MTNQALTSKINPDLQSQLDDLEGRMQAHLGGRVQNLSLVLLSNGIVIQGVAHTYYGKQLAQHAVMESTSLPIVANEIVVL